MESRHIVKNARVSLRKVRSFIPAVKKLSPAQAVLKLEQLPHSAAQFLAAAIKTAMANAENALKVPKGMLEFRSLQADQGLALKRFRAGSRGTAKPIVRRMTHITVVLAAQKTEAKAASKTEKEITVQKKEEKKTVSESKKEEKEIKKPRKTAVKKSEEKVTKKDN